MANRINDRLANGDVEDLACRLDWLDMLMSTAYRLWRRRAAFRSACKSRWNFIIGRTLHSWKCTGRTAVPYPRRRNVFKNDTHPKVH